MSPGGCRSYVVVAVSGQAGSWVSAFLPTKLQSTPTMGLFFKFDYKTGFAARGDVAHDIMSASCPCAFILGILWAAVTLLILLCGAAQVLHMLLWQLSGSDCSALSWGLQKIQSCGVAMSDGSGGTASCDWNLNFLQNISWVGIFARAHEPQF